MILQRIDEFERRCGQRPRRGYCIAWHEINRSEIVYAPAGLHLVLRLLRAAGWAWVCFCQMSSL